MFRLIKSFAPHLTVYTLHIFEAKAVVNMVKIRCALLPVWLVIGLTMAPVALAEPMEVKYYSKGNSPGLWPYQEALLVLALEKTRKDFGDYKITYFEESISSARAKKETERGRLIDVHYSTAWTGLFVNADNIIQLEYPIFKGLLGLRSVIVRERGSGKLQKNLPFDEFRQLSAGQGAGWVDINILENSGIRVVKSGIFNNLVPMLFAGRYDYLPLSILETKAVVDGAKIRGMPIVQSTDAMLFYPLPIAVCISKSNPELAKRLSQGFERALADGSLESVFAEHFGFVEPWLKKNAPTTYVIQNPLLDEPSNQRLTGAFHRQYGSWLKMVK